MCTSTRLLEKLLKLAKTVIESPLETETSNYLMSSVVLSLVCLLQNQMSGYKRLMDAQFISTTKGIPDSLTSYTTVLNNLQNMIDFSRLFVCVHIVWLMICLLSLASGQVANNTFFINISQHDNVHSNPKSRFPNKLTNLRDMFSDTKDKSWILVLIRGSNDEMFLQYTWVYTVTTNSSLQLPGSVPDVSLPVTHKLFHAVLSTFVVLINTVQDIWGFDGQNEMWMKLKIPYSWSRYTVGDDLDSTGTVALDKWTYSSSNCTCKGSLLFYGLRSKRCYFNCLVLQIHILNTIVWQDLMASYQFPVVTLVILLKDNRTSALYVKFQNMSEAIKFNRRPSLKYNRTSALYVQLKKISEAIDNKGPTFTTQSSELGFGWRRKGPPKLLKYKFNQTFDLAEDIWSSLVHTKSLRPLISPGYLCYHIPVYDYNSKTIYLYAGLQSANGKLSNSSAGSLWILIIPSNNCWLVKPKMTPSVCVSNCGTFSGMNHVLFGGKYGNATIRNELWLYSSTNQIWNRIGTFRNSPWPAARAGCSMFASRTRLPIILLGGYSHWGEGRLYICSWSLDFSFRDTGVWQQMAPSEEGSLKQIPSRFMHSSLTMDDELIMYGGIAKVSGTVPVCLSDMRAFHTSRRSWRKAIISSHQNNANNAKSVEKCEYLMLAFGVNRAVVVEKVNANGVTNVLWMIDIMFTLNNQTYQYSPRIYLSVQAEGIGNGSLVYYGQDTGRKRTRRDALTVLRHSSKPGHAIDCPSESCKRFPIGWYSRNCLDVMNCVTCPRETTANQIGMMFISICKCYINYCKHGRCILTDVDNDGIDAVCVTVTSLIFVIATTALTSCAIRNIRHQRARKRIERELEETRRAFSIDPQEIELLERLDEDCPGGYGQVHKGTYREWTVAVKQLKLIMAEWADIRRDFLREIQIMRAIRHPNIVMFVGAGQFDDNHLFIVLEFMRGGALHSLLQNNEEELTMKERLQFSLDTAEGMKYLHTLQPPRIHRDLKSANLLLGSTRQVRVADFGSARLVPQPNRRRPATRRRRTSQPTGEIEQISQHLLSDQADLTSRHIGTPRWRSPELWRRQSYGTATDVYRYI